MARPEVNPFVGNPGITIDYSSYDVLERAEAGNNFSGIMNLADNAIYLAPLARPAKDDHYNTQEPAFLCKVAGALIDPLVHSEALTSHHQLANFVIAQGGGGKLEDFCGFALRFSSAKQADLAPTSRTLNPGYNGTLEDTLFQAIYAFLKPKLDRVGKTLEKAGPRVNPDAAHQKRTQASGIQNAVNLPKNLLSSIKKI